MSSSFVIFYYVPSRFLVTITQLVPVFGYGSLNIAGVSWHWIGFSIVNYKVMYFYLCAVA